MSTLLDAVDAIVRARSTCDASTSRLLARDLAVVALGARTSFMNDYAPRVTPALLATLSSECARTLAVDARELRAMTMHGTTFVVNVRVLAREASNWRGIFVDLSGHATEPAAGTAAADAWECVQAALLEALRAREGVIDISDIVDAQSDAIGPPTVSGVLLDFPCVYAFPTECMSSAAAMLSSCSLSVHSIECRRRDGVDNESELAYGWSIPSSLIMDDDARVKFEAAVATWRDVVADCLRSLGFCASHQVAYTAPGSNRIAF